MKDITSWATGLSDAASAPLAPVAAHPPAGPSAPTAPHASSDDAAYLQALAAEALGWQPLGEQAYLHMGAQDDVRVVLVVGVADTTMADQNVLLLNY